MWHKRNSFCDTVHKFKCIVGRFFSCLYEHIVITSDVVLHLSCDDCRIRGKIIGDVFSCIACCSCAQP